MRLNLTKDRDGVVEWITGAVPKIARSRKRAKTEPITRLDLSFDVSSMEVPLAYFGFSTEPGGEPGHSSHWVAEQDFPHWARPCGRALGGKELEVVSPPGTKTVNDETTLCEAIGLYFVDVVKQLRDAGTFRHLPVAQKCYLGVASYDGTYAWPWYEHRGPDNML